MEDVRVERGEGEGTDATAGPADAAAQPVSAVTRVDEGHELLHDVILVAAGGGRVDVLAAAEAGEAVREDEDDARHPAGDEVVEVGVIPGIAEATVQEHEAATREAHQAEDDGVPLVGRCLVVRREVDRKRADVRIAERVALEDFALVGDVV